MPIPMSAVQIADDLSDRIRAGEYPPGSKLPSLRELGEIYSVSVSTIQRAAGLLRDRGLMEGSPGRGMFVAEK